MSHVYTYSHNKITWYIYVLKQNKFTSLTPKLPTAVFAAVLHLFANLTQFVQLKES